VNTAFVSLHASPGVRLNPLYSTSGAVLGTALVCAVLLWAFTHPLPNIPAQFMQLSLVAAPVSPPKRVAASPRRPVRTPTPKTVARPVMAKPLVIPEASPVKPVASPAPLDMSLPGLTFAPPAASGFAPHAFNPYSDLSRALAAPPPLPTMQNGDAYRSAYGFSVIQADGRCAELKTIQIGPSPSVKANVAFAMPCPGEYKPTMADELKAWADKQASKNHNPS
jgi:hypothetical protein